MPLDLTDMQRDEIELCLEDDYYEGAVELVLEAFPDCTRDEAVDIVEEIDRERKAR